MRVSKLVIILSLSVSTIGLSACNMTLQRDPTVTAEKGSVKFLPQGYGILNQKMMRSPILKPPGMAQNQTADASMKKSAQDAFDDAPDYDVDNADEMMAPVTAPQTSVSKVVSAPEKLPSVPPAPRVEREPTIGTDGNAPLAITQTQQQTSGKSPILPTDNAPQAQQPVVAAKPESDLVWHDLGNTYRAGNYVPPTEDDLAPIGSTAMAPSRQQSGAQLQWNEVALERDAAGDPSIAYNRNVMVYPVDGDVSAFTMPQYENASYGNDGIPTSLVSADGVRLIDRQAREMGYDTAEDMVMELFFAHGSSKIPEKDKKKVRDLASAILRTQNASLRVVGHASKRVDHVKDPVKAAMINFEMSMKRAAAVTREMYKAGVTPAWVEAVARGDTEPNENIAGMAQEDADRRVEVFMNAD